MASPDGHLSTVRFQLVPVAVDQAELLHPMMRDERLTRFLAWRAHRDARETTEVLAALAASNENGSAFHWTIVEGAKARGLISLIDIKRTHREWILDRAEIAYWIDPELQGRGIATEATDAVVRHAFECLALNRVRISHTSANPASGRIPQKLGFRFVGTEREFFQKRGVWHDMNHYELTKTDWESRNGDAS